MEAWQIAQFVLQLVGIIAAGIGVYSAIRADIQVLHANLINARDDIKELQTDVKRHEREIAGLDRRHHEMTGSHPAHMG